MASSAPSLSTSTPGMPAGSATITTWLKLAWVMMFVVSQVTAPWPAMLTFRVLLPLATTWM